MAQVRLREQTCIMTYIHVLLLLLNLFDSPEAKIDIVRDSALYEKALDMDTVTGKGQIIYWSHNPEKSIFSGYRFERIFDFLE